MQIKEFDISDLKPGMFVDKVLEQSGKLKVKSKGMVRSPEVIESLSKQGVLKLRVDLSKSLKEIQDLYPEEQTEELVEEVCDDIAEKQEPSSTNKAPTKSVSFEQEIDQANQLYDQAKKIQSQALENMKAGKPINTKAMKDVADGFMESVFRNPDALACMTRMRDKNAYLMEHSINVSIIMTIFAKHLKLEKNIIHQLATGALLHDLGKIGIPDKILDKPSRLDDHEMSQMQSHVTLGHTVLQRSGELSQIILEVVEDHHERLDGTGYPNGKTADELSLYARMIAIVDTYDAITATRCYQDARTPITAFKILRAESGTKYDTKLVTDFINCMGIHPVGTLVKLKSNKLGIVIKSNYVNPIAPKIHIFYSVTNKSYIEPKVIDLADANVEDEIDKSIKPEDFKIDMVKYFKEVLLP